MLCNLFHELGYIFTLLTVKNFDVKSNNDSFNSNTIYFKSPDDCQYFASKTIKNLVSVLSYLEKPIINLILKQKIINKYVPELTSNLEHKCNSTVSFFSYPHYYTVVHKYSELLILYSCFVLWYYIEFK